MAPSIIQASQGKQGYQNFHQRPTDGDVWRCDWSPRQSSIGWHHKSWVSDQGSRGRHPSGSGSSASSWSLVAELESSKSIGKRANRFGAMADCVLHFGGQFTESLLESVRNENRVVAKSGVASRFIGDTSFRNSFEGSEEIAVAREHHDAAKSSTTPILCSANSRKLAK